MIEHMMPLCLTISWVHSVALLCVLQVCVHDRTCDAAVPDNLVGVQRCYASTEHCLREGTSSQRGKALTSTEVPSSPDGLDNLWVRELLVIAMPCSPLPFRLTCTLRASLSGTFLQTLPDLVTPLKGHSLSLRSVPLTRSAPSERFGY